nr:prothymosin alpha-like [Rattus norvegicus]
MKEADGEERDRKPGKEDRKRERSADSCIGPPACHTTPDAAVDTSSEITTKGLKEKEEVVEETENERDAPANGNAQNEENGEQEADNEVDEEEEEGGEEEEEEEGDGEEEDGDEDEEAEAPTGKRVAEDGEDDDVDTEKQKTDEDDQTAKGKANLTHRDLFTLHFPSQNLNVVTFE